MTIYGCYRIEHKFRLNNNSYVRFLWTNIILCQTSFHYDLMWDFFMWITYAQIVLNHDIHLWGSSHIKLEILLRTSFLEK